MIKDEIPENIITIRWSIFLNSLTIRAKKVRGIVNSKPNCSGTILPKKIPIKVETCHKNHKVKPEPNKW